MKKGRWRLFPNRAVGTADPMLRRIEFRGDTRTCFPNRAGLGSREWRPRAFSEGPCSP